MKNLFQSESLPVRFLTRVCDLMLLSLMFSFLAMTVVLSGAALTALYSQTLKMVNGEEDSIVKGYLVAVKENFIPSFPATLLLFLAVFHLLVIGYALSADVLIFSPFVFVAICIMFLLLTAFLSWLFPLLARYDAGFGHQCKNALFLTFAKLPVTFLLVFFNLLPLMIGFRFPGTVGYLIGVWLMIGFGGVAYINSWYLRRCFESMSESGDGSVNQGRVL